MKRSRTKENYKLHRNGQMSFAGPLFNKEAAFGGALMKKAKFRTARPLDTKHPIHLVMRSSQAKGRLSFRTPKNYGTISKTLGECAKVGGVKVIEFSNNGNHLHVLIKITNRTLYKKFIRQFSGAVVQRLTGNYREKLKDKFWTYRPFTRVVFGWRGYAIARDYVVLNQLEALGILEYQSGGLTTVHRPLLDWS